MATQGGNRVSKFFKDFGIYTIGVLGTRVITFLMVPLYTYFIENPSDYGYYDLCLTLCMMLIPLATLQLREGAFRFLYSAQSHEQREKVVTFIYRTMGINILVILLIVVAISQFFHIAYIWHTAALLVVMSIHEVVAQTSRGLHKNKVYVANSIINAVAIGVFSVLFVWYMDMGIEGIFFANILSRVCAVTFIELKLHIIPTYFKPKTDVKSISHEILRYVLPLIPTIIFWDMTLGSDRFFINYFIGFEANGVYAVAVRFTAILQTLSLILYQTWQETAISQYDSPDRSSFFSSVFNLFVFTLVALLFVYTFVLKMNYGWLVNDKYQHSLMYIFPMGVAAIFNALSSSFFDLCYQCSKETHRAFRAIVLALVINLTCNFFLVPRLGVWGVITTSMTTYVFLVVYRSIDTRRYFTLTVNPSTLVPVLLVPAGAFMFYCQHSFLLDIATIVVALSIMWVALPRQYSAWVKDRFRSLLHRRVPS